MDVVELIAEARKDGVKIEVVGSDLQIEAKQSQKHWLTKLRQYKQEIVAHLSGEPTAEEIGELPPQAELFRPFPTAVLPQPICGFITAGAKAIGCDETYLALPLLSVLAAAIGDSRCIRLKPGWSAPAILWTCIVGESGSMKSPALRLAIRPVRDRQRRAFERYEEEMRQYEIDLAFHEKSLSGWKRDKRTSEPPPEKPELPTVNRYVVGDVTVEALAPLLLENPRGVLLAHDELRSWFGSFDKYTGAGKGGTDEGSWLSMYNGESISVDRKTGHPRTIFVPHARVSLTGSIPPAILNRALGVEHFESGLAARLLLVCPPRKPKRWTEASIDPVVESKLGTLIDRLYEMEPAVDDEGHFYPLPLQLTNDAKEIWKRFYDDHAKQLVDLTGALAASWSKLEETPARLSLVIHCVRLAAGDPTLESPGTIDAATLKAGVELTQWFKHETKRVYALLAESDEQKEQRELVDWISRRGGEVKVREIQQGHRKYRTAADVEEILRKLEKAGYGHWNDIPPGPKGGRPTRVFRLSTVSTSTQPNKIRDPEGFVDVDSVDVPQTPMNGEAVHVADGDNDWGEI